jgi:hypothetical protein
MYEIICKKGGLAATRCYAALRVRFCLLRHRQNHFSSWMVAGCDNPIKKIKVSEWVWYGVLRILILKATDTEEKPLRDL